MQFTIVALTAFVAALQPCSAALIPQLLQTVTGGGSKRSDITSNLDQCVQNFHDATEHVQLSGNSVVMDGVPASCIQEAKAWNAHPHADVLAKDYGTVKILGEQKIQLDGLPQKTVDQFKSAIKPE